MKHTMVRLARLRETQRRQAELGFLRIKADLAAATLSEDAVMQSRMGEGRLQRAVDLQHGDMLLGYLHQTAENLTVQLITAQHELRDRSREAKQMEKIVALHKAALATKVARAEQQTVETWLRGRSRPQEDLL